MRFPGADATELPYDDASFDVVAQFTALCNLLHARLRVRAGREMARVVRPAGAVLWFDVARTRSPEPHGIAAGELRGLFADFEVLAERGCWYAARC
jgi:ubiquinone/menaquinone biosynthesis C-methylase UbiE